MSKRRKIFIILSVIGAVVIILLTAKAIAHNATHILTPEITASPDVTLKYPEPTIKADSKAKLPKEARPLVKTTPAPKVEAPAPIAETREFPLFPLYPIQEQAPYSIVPEPAPAQGPTYPSLPPVSTITPPSVPVRPPSIPDPTPLPPELPIGPENPVTGPVKGILEPIIPTLPALPKLPNTIEVEQHLELRTEEVLSGKLRP